VEVILPHCGPFAILLNRLPWPPVYWVGLQHSYLLMCYMNSSVCTINCCKQLNKSMVIKAFLRVPYINAWASVIQTMGVFQNYTKPYKCHILFVFMNAVLLLHFCVASEIVNWGCSLYRSCGVSGSGINNLIMNHWQFNIHVLQFRCTHHSISCTRY